METIHLNCHQYTKSIAEIADESTQRFAKQAQTWWSRHFSWNSDGCRVLINGRGEHLAYLFYKVDRYRDYLTIHNLFTPQIHRHNGYALAMLEEAFQNQADRDVKRFHMSCTPQALGFYARLSLIYWGVDIAGNYHCDLPLPSDGIDGIPGMVERETNRTLLGGKGESIYRKVRDNGTAFEESRRHRFEEDKKSLCGTFRHDALKKILAPDTNTLK